MNVWPIKEHRRRTSLSSSCAKPYNPGWAPPSCVSMQHASTHATASQPHGVSLQPRLATAARCYPGAAMEHRCSHPPGLTERERRTSHSSGDQQLHATAWPDRGTCASQPATAANAPQGPAGHARQARLAVSSRARPLSSKHASTSRVRAHAAMSTAIVCSSALRSRQLRAGLRRCSAPSAGAAACRRRSQSRQARRQTYERAAGM